MYWLNFMLIRKFNNLNLNSENSKENIYQKIVAICLILSPIFSNYVFISAISVGDLLIFITLPWLIGKIRLNPLIILNVTVPLIIISISYFILGGQDVYSGFYRAAFYYCLIMLAISVKNINSINLIKFYRSIVLISSAAVIIQWIGYYIFDTSMPMQLPLEYYEPDTLNVIDHVFRAGGFFKEPSYFAIYVMPYFIYAALMRKFLHLFIISVAGVLSTSSLMFFLIFMCAVILFCRIFNLFFATLFIGIVFGLFAFFIFGGFLDGYIFIDRVHSIFIDGGTLIDRFLPFVEIFKISNVFLPSAFVLDFFLSVGLWFNSAASIVTYFGMGGLIFLLLNSFRFGLIYSILFSVLLISTHFMSGAFSYFIAITFLILKNYLENPLHNDF